MQKFTNKVNDYAKKEKKETHLFLCLFLFEALSWLFFTEKDYTGISWRNYGILFQTTIIKPVLQQTESYELFGFPMHIKVLFTF